MLKTLKNIKKKLLTSPLSELNGEELMEYYSYRLDNLISDKKVIVKRELEYLLCDVGKGSLRFDPELLSILNDESVIIQKNLEPLLRDDKKKKVKIEKDINNFLCSVKNAKNFIKILNCYCKNISILSKQPLIIEATYKKIPTLILIKNGQWVLPGNELLNFIKQAKELKKQPIIIAKKIHGILFPFFKGMSILGSNIYSTLLDKKNIKLINNLENKVTLSGHYNERIEDLENFADNINTEYYDGNLLKKFFERLLPKYLNEYYQRNLEQKNKITNFKNTVKTVKSIKAKNGILKWVDKRNKLISELKKN